MEPLLTVTTLAKRLSVSNRTIFRWTASGAIPYIVVGKAKRYDYPAVIAALEAK